MMCSLGSRLFFAAVFTASVVSCGAQKKQDPTTEEPGSNPSDGDGNTRPEEHTPPANNDGVQKKDNFIVRGRWTMPMSADTATHQFRFSAATPLTDASSSTPMSATVAAAVTFTVSNAHFTTPPTTGVASYGTLDVTALKDNALRVCGTTGNQKCTKGIIRTYTTGTAGAGLWSTVEGIGLPITSTGGAVVGLTVAGAFNAASYTIPAGKTTLKLSDFTSATALAVPFSVDFTDAAASSYSTTLVLEYATQ